VGEEVEVSREVEALEEEVMEENHEGVLVGEIQEENQGV
jgi:hypothetical protein